MHHCTKSQITDVKFRNKFHSCIKNCDRAVGGIYDTPVYFYLIDRCMRWLLFRLSTDSHLYLVRYVIHPLYICLFLACVVSGTIDLPATPEKQPLGSGMQLDSAVPVMAKGGERGTSLFMRRGFHFPVLRPTALCRGKCTALEIRLDDAALLPPDHPEGLGVRVVGGGVAFNGDG